MSSFPLVIIWYGRFHRPGIVNKRLVSQTREAPLLSSQTWIEGQNLGGG
jgi:hypothetical protein